MKAREQTITIEWSLNPDNVPGEVTVTITQSKDTEPIFQYTTELPTHDEVYAWAEQSR